MTFETHPHKLIALSRNNRWFCRVIRAFVFFALGVNAVAVGADPPPGSEKSGLASELFKTFVELRQSIGAKQHSDPQFYSRKWIELSLRSALDDPKQPDRPGLNWTADSLLSSFGLGLTVDKIFSYALADETDESAKLALHVTYCERPSSLIIGFIVEDGKWRVSTVRYDSTEKAKSWYRPELPPVVEFAHVDVRDRSRYFNESNLGTAVGLDVNPHKPCAAQGASQNEIGPHHD